MSHSPDRGGPSARRERGRAAPVSVECACAAGGACRGVRRGFSLLELTLVLAIIAALMGVAAFALLGQGNAARIQTTKQSLTILKTAIEQYQLNHGVYPDTLARLVTVQYVEPKSMEDSFRQPLYYRTPGLNGRPFTLISGGPDTDLATPADNIDVWTMNATGGQ